MPGMKIIIKDDDVVVNFAWHINGEIIEYLIESDFKNQIFIILPNCKIV